jgi:CheY-like chemotaxis protein
LTSDQVIRLITAVGQLIGVLIWPAALVFFLVFFRRSLRNFMADLGEFSFKAPGVEATAKRQEVEAAVALGAAEAARGPVGEESRPVVVPRDVADALPSSREQRRLQGSRVLWVDDRPGNNVFERQALEALGIQIDLSTSTEDAIQRIRQRPYDLIISDMGRPPDAQAGYTLLDQLRKAGDRTPYVLYTGTRAPEAVREAREHGAIGCTNSPPELVSMVTTALAARGRG